MKRLCLILFFVPALYIGCRTAKVPASASTTDVPGHQPVASTDAPAQVWDFRDATTWILGDFNPDRLKDLPHSQWFMKGYDEYVPDPKVIDELKAMDMSDLRITVALGTWCPDSRREVPRFMRIIDQLGFPKEKIRFIGVDINKVAPLDDFTKLDIVRVPTFIFYENNIESGRIIEVPVSSLEQDMKDILTRKMN